jgi:predicted aminopeptidase
MRVIVTERRSGKRATHSVRRSLPRVAAALVACLSLPGCYVMQAAGGQLDVMARSKPIAKVLDDPATPAATRSRLELATQARTFAVQELGLPDGDSYQSYADLSRPYALWNVVATPEFSLQPQRWCFPVAGCVAYRGYFDEADANSKAWSLTAHGKDAVVEGVATYSTLGHLPDPVFSTMLGWSETRFVGTIFHELAHERLYVPGDSAFNEAFASVVEEAGVRRWLAVHGRAAEVTAYETSRRRQVEFVALLRTTRAGLSDLYASDVPPDEMRVAKNREFGLLKFEYAKLRVRWGGYGGYDAWFARPLNNARLASVATYHDCMPGLERELASAGSLPAFYERAEALAKLTVANRRAALCGAESTVGDAARRSGARLPGGPRFESRNGTRLVETGPSGSPTPGA